MFFHFYFLGLDLKNLILTSPVQSHEYSVHKKKGNLTRVTWTQSLSSNHSNVPAIFSEEERCNFTIQNQNQEEDEERIKKKNWEEEYSQFLTRFQTVKTPLFRVWKREWRGFRGRHCTDLHCLASPSSLRRAWTSPELPCSVANRLRAYARSTSQQPPLLDLPSVGAPTSRPRCVNVFQTLRLCLGVLKEIKWSDW